MEVYINLAPDHEIYKHVSLVSNINQFQNYGYNFHYNIQKKAVCILATNIREIMLRAINNVVEPPYVFLCHVIKLSSMKKVTTSSPEVHFQ